jgi:hypothetical protein
MSEIEKKVCENCPFNVALDVGVNEIYSKCNETELHQTTDRHKAAIGATKLARALLTGVVSRMGCEGPVTVDGGYIVCPNMRTVIDARNFVEGPTGSALQLEGLADKPSTTGTGQYL